MGMRFTPTWLHKTTLTTGPQQRRCQSRRQSVRHAAALGRTFQLRD